jgi:hypothetical protein
VSVEAESDNPVGWPYLLTRELIGRPLLDFAQRPSDLDWRLRCSRPVPTSPAAHSITFDGSGYILAPNGLAPIRLGRRRPTPCTIRLRSKPPPSAISPSHGPSLAADLADDLESRFHVIGETIAPEYDPPRFVHAACHPNHPYVERSGGVLRVSGCVDMESASAGAVSDDLTTPRQG